MGDLGDRLANGEPAAFAELYDHCADRLHPYLAARLGSAADADDVIQETFVRLARSRPKLAKVDNLVAYVFTVARNEAARLQKGNKREAAARDPASPAAALEQAVADADHDLRDTAQAVRSALAGLSTAERELIELKYFAGLTLREIAEITGLPPGTVATRYRTALARLRERLQRNCHE